MNADGTRIELQETLENLEAEAEALRAKRAVITYRLGRLAHEISRTRRHIAALDLGGLGGEDQAC